MTGDGGAEASTAGVSVDKRAGREGRAFPVLRWALPGALLGGEIMALSLLIDLPTGGPSLRLAEALRVAFPVLVGAAVAGWIQGKASGAPRTLERVSLPRWRPFPALVLQLVVFALTAALGLRLLGPGRPPAPSGLFVAWLGCLALTALLALASAVPLGSMARQVLTRWRAPLLALALGAVVWRAALGTEALWGGDLAVVVLRAAAALLRLGGSEVALDAAERLIGSRGFEISVAPVCSGADGIGLVVAVLIIWLGFARERLRLGRALVLLPLGAAAAFGANVLRIAALVWVGAAGHEAVAVGGFHSKLGWVLFIAVALGGVALAERLPWFRRPRPMTAPPDAVAAETDVEWLLPLLASLGTGLVAGLWLEGALDLWYGARIAAALAALYAIRRSLPALAPSRHVFPVLLGLAAGAVWILASRGDPAPLAGELARLGSSVRGAWIAVRVLGSVAVIPLVEELAFRGFLLPWLGREAPRPDAARRQAWRLPAVLLSSLAFGAIHQTWWLGAVAGLVFAVARLWRGRLGDAVVAHAVANALVAVAALAGRWDLWG